MTKRRLKWLSFFIIVMIGALSSGIGVFADDDDEREEDRKAFENYEDYDDHQDYDDDDEYDDDEEDYEEGYGEGYQTSILAEKGYWNFWIREAVSSQDTELPILQPADVTIKTNGVPGSIHVVPKEGQLLVPGDKVAKLLKAKSVFYPNSRILIISNNNSELIVRAGSNAAYENKIKTPIPIQAQYIEKSLYIPISVAANSMGYRVSWNEAEQSLILENL